MTMPFSTVVHGPDNLSHVGLMLLAARGGTMVGHEPYMGPAKLTDARPWADEAACRNQPDIFEAAERARPRAPGGRQIREFGPGPIERAKALCASCPAIAQCLSEVMAEESGGPQHRWSVRAGLTPTERAELWEAETGVRLLTETSLAVIKQRSAELWSSAVA